ncbi:MAG: hypothetical protein ABR521_14745 [Gaiellaceae bacterium]
MTVGIKALLLFVAVILFVIGVFVDDPTDVWSLGLAATAAGLLVDALGMDRPLGGGAPTTTRR